jgi:translocation and assembly module TamA
MSPPPQEEKSSRGALGVRHGGKRERYARLLQRGLTTLQLVCVLSLLAGGAAARAEVGIEYEVTVSGIADSEIRTRVESVIETVALRVERPLASLGLLRQRVEADVPRILSVLRSEGYYDAQVATAVDRDVKPVQVTFRIDPGPRYRIKEVEINSASKGPAVPSNLPKPADIGLERGEVARARTVLDGEAKLLTYLKDRGYPFARVEERQAVVDHADHSMSVRFRVEPGPIAYFGPTTITGLQSVDASVILHKIPWREGDLYQGSRLGELQKKLTTTGLFSSVEITSGKAVDEKGRVPVTVAVIEGKHRTVTAGVGYRTDEGPGANVSWEHRNFFHAGERLTVAGKASGITRSLETTFRKPTLWREDQRLTYTLRLAEDRPDTYRSRNLAGSLVLERELTKGLVAGAGVGAKAADVSQEGPNQKFLLLSVPLSLGWNGTDNLLDPKRGTRLALQVAPYQDLVSENVRFIKAKVSTSHYLQVVSDPSVVLAGRGAVGLIEGTSRLSVPADERFYAGGGGSIRGYRYQSVGPLENDKPTGGRSFVELSLETRLRVSERLGLIAFIDGGTAFANEPFSSSSDEEEMRWGTGLGFAYYTPIGPFRLDVAVPLNRRQGVDDSFQIYVSLGQAF